jgi:hypothetical protein
MLDRLTTSTSSLFAPQPKPSPRVVRGKDFAEFAKGSATARALAAYEHAGAIIDRLTQAQATSLCGANTRYVSELRKMTPLEIADGGQGEAHQVV